MRGCAKQAATFIAVGVLAAGCSVAVPGTAVPDPDAPQIKLDVGGLATKPRSPITSSAQQKVLAANILADHMVLPTDLDPAFTQPGLLSVRAVVQSNNLKNTLDDADVERIGQRGLLYGFVSGRSSAIKDVQAGITVVVLRMTDVNAAKGVVDELRSAGGASEKIDDRADWAVRKTGPDDSRKYTTFTAYAAVGAHVAIVIPWASDEANTRAMVSRAMDPQVRLLTGLESPGRDELAGLPADKDSIVSHTVAPEPIEQGKFETNYGFRGKRGSLHQMIDPVATGKVFDEVGMDLAGHGRNMVVRTRDAAAAKRLVGAWVAEIEKKKSVTPFVIDGLPGAQCRSYDDDGVFEQRIAACYLAEGRYVSDYKDVQLERVRQVTSAAYLILRTAP